jgi:hypothetical protein
METQSMRNGLGVSAGWRFCRCRLVAFALLAERRSKKGQYALVTTGQPLHKR